MQSILTFKDAKGGVYEVPENELAEFQKALPDAIPTTTYKGGNGKMYSVPTTDTERFMQSVPDAKPALRINTDDGQKFGVPVSDVGEFYDQYKKAPEMQKEREKTIADIRGPDPKKKFFKAADTASGILDAISGLGTSFPAAYYQLAEGLKRPDQYSEEAKASFEKADFRNLLMNTKTEEKRRAGTSSSTGESFREAGGSLGFSINSMLAMIPGALAGTALGYAAGSATRIPGVGAAGKKIGKVAGGMATSGIAAYRMAGASFLNEAWQSIQEESMRKNGRKMNEEEMQSAYKELLPIAQNTALWEAGPEAVGNAVTVGAGKIVFGLGKGLSKKFAVKASAAIGSLATELGTETLTQVEQSADQQKSQAIAQGQDPNAIKADWSPSGVTEAFKDVAPQTLALMGLIGGAGSVSGGAYNASSRLKVWAKANPKQALEIAKMEVPSRVAFEKAGLPRVPQDERIAMAGTLSDMSAEIETNLASAQAAKAQHAQVELEAQKQRSAESRDAQERGAKIEKVMNDLDEVSTGIPDNDPVFAENQDLIEEIGAKSVSKQSKAGDSVKSVEKPAETAVKAEAKTSKTPKASKRWNDQYNKEKVEAATAPTPVSNTEESQKVPPPESLKHIEGTAAWDEVSDRIEGLQIAVERAKKDGDSEKIRTAIRAFDGNLFGQYKNSLTELQSIREHLSPIINKILGDGYSISWASPSSVLDLSTQIQNVENGEGTVFYARTAEIRSKSGALVEKGLVETVAPTDAQYTALDLTKTNPPKIASPTEKGFLSTREMKELEGTVEYRHVNSKITRLAKEIASADNDAKITRVSRAIEAIDTALTESFGDNARVLEQMRQFVTSEFQSKAAEYINFAWPEKGATFDAKTMKTSTGEKNTEGEVLSAKSVIMTTVGGSIISKSMVELAEPTPPPAETPPAPKAKIGRKGVTKKAPKTIEEADANIALQKASSEFIGSMKEESAQKLQRDKQAKFVDDNTTTHAESVMLRDMISGSYDKALDDISSGRVSPERADALAQSALDAGFTDQFNRNRFKKPPSKIGAKGVTKKAVEEENEFTRERLKGPHKSIADRIRKISSTLQDLGTNKGTRPLDTKWVPGAIKRLLKYENIMPDKQGGEFASAKIALSKATTIEQLNAIADKLESKAPNDDVKPPATAPAKKIGAKGVTKKPAEEVEKVEPAKPAAVDNNVNAIEYITRDVFNGKSPKSAIKSFVKKFKGSENVFLGDTSRYDADSLMKEYVSDKAQTAIDRASRMKPGRGFMALEGTAKEFGLSTEELSVSVKKLLGDSEGNGILSSEPPAPAAPKAAETAKVKGDTITSPAGEKKARLGTLQPAEQKKYLMAEIDKAIAVAPESSDGETVVIEVPGDGIFTIQNNQTALNKFKSKAKKFPTSVSKPENTKKATLKTNPTAIPKVAKVRPEKRAELDKIMKDAVSTDETRQALLTPHLNGEAKELVATDGRRMSVALGQEGKTTIHKNVSGTEIFYPNYGQAIPGYRAGQLPEMQKNKSVVNTAYMISKLNQVKAASTGIDYPDPVQVIRMPNGRIEIKWEHKAYGNAPKDADVIEMYQSDDLTGGELIGLFDTKLLKGSFTALRKMGNEDVTLTWNDRYSPFVAVGKSEYEIFMPEQTNQEAKAAAEKREAEKAASPAKAVASGGETKKTVANTVKAPLENVSDKDKARVTEIKAKLAKMRNRMSFGVDPEFLSLGTELTTIYIKGGVKTFKQYASVMKQELGEAWAELKGNLRMLWEKAAVDYPDIEDISRKESEAIIAELDSVDPMPSPEPKIGSKGVTRKTVKRKPETGDDALGKVTSLRESVAEVERMALGYPAEVKDAARRFPEVVDKAWDRINKNPDAGQNLIDELGKEARPLRDYEVAMLTIVKQQRFNERQKALEEVKLAENGTEAEKSEAAKRLEVAAEKLEEVFAVAERGANKSITETARGLVALKMLMSDKYELVEMEQSVRDSQGGKPLNDKQQSELARIKAEYDATRKTLDEEIDRLNKTVGSLERDIADAQATAKYSAMIDEILNGGGIKLKVSDRMLAYADKLEKEALAGMRKAATRMSSGVDPMALVNATKLGTAYFIRLSAKGTASFEVWADKMREDFGSDSDKIEPYLKRIFMDAFIDANKHIEIKTQAPKAKPQTSEEIIGQIKELPAIDDKVLSTNIKDLYRLQVAEGVTVLDEATENVNAQLREAGIDMTNEQVRDIFSDYGKSRPVTKDEAKLILADMRRQAQLVASIERVMQDLAPLKTGQQRPRPTSTTRELSRKLNKLLKEAGINVVDRETTLATALQSMKTRLNNSIEDMTKAIASNERMTENRSILNLDEEAKELVARRDELRKQYEEVFPRKPLTDQQRLDIAVRATERSLKEWNDRLENAKKGIFTKPEKESGYSQNEFIKAIKAERDAVKAEVARLKKIAYPRRTPTQIAIDNKRKGLERSIVEMRRRIKENDFAPRKRHVIDGSGDEAFLEAQARHKMVKIEFDQIKEAARWRELSPTSKAIEIATEVYDMARNIAYSADDSFLGRQGWFYMMSHPVKWLGAGTKSMKAFSRKQSRKQGEKFSERPNSRNGLYKKAGLELNEINETGDVQEADDMFRMNLTRKIPGVGQVVDASGRSFATASNEIRGSFFDSLLNNTKRGRKIQADPANLSKEDIAFLEDIAWGVNVLSGRSTLGHAEGAARVLGAPRFIKATFDTILHRPITRPLFKGDYAAAGSFAKEYLRAYAVLSAIYIVANLFLGDDDKTEWDPRSSKFGNIKISDGYSINPMAAIAPQIRFLARLITGQKKTGKGVKNLRKSFLPFASETEKLDKVAYGDSQWSDTGMYLRTKLHPGLNAAAGVLTGEDFWGNERSRWKLLAGSFLPISPVQAVEAYQAKGAVSGVAVGVSEFFGLSTNPNFNDPDILRQTAGSEEKFAEQIGAKLYAASGPGTDAESRKNMRDFVLGMKKSGTTDAEIYAMLEAEQKSKGLSTKKTENGGRRSSYGRRLQNVKEILAGADAPDAATMRDTGLAIYKATEKTSTPEEIAKAKEVMASMSLPEKVKALKYAMKEYGESSTDKSGKFTDAYRKRLILLKSIK